MRTEIPSGVVRDLQRLGMEPRPDDFEAIEISLRPFDWVDRLGWDVWYAIAGTVGQDELADLARGLVRAEKIPRWGGGSVAAAIWVFRSYSARFDDRSDKLAEWMLANSVNPWVPFGSNRGSARTLEEYRVYVSYRAERRTRSHDDSERKTRLKAAREAVRQRLSPYRQRIQRAISAARADLVREIEILSPLQRVEHLALDDQHPLSFFPIELAGGADAIWEQLDQETREKIYSRASAIPRGPWRRWFKAISLKYPSK